MLVEGGAKVIDADGSTATTNDRSENGAGWGFAATTSDDDDAVSPASGTTSDAGILGFAVTMEGGEAVVTLDETEQTGYSLIDIECTGTPAGLPPANEDLEAGTIDVTVKENSIVTCTYVNARWPELTLVKDVQNNKGGTAVASDWTLGYAGTASSDSDPGSGTGTKYVVPAGSYTISETGGPASGYTAQGWNCEGGAAESDVDSKSATIELGLGQRVTCTIVNADEAAQVQLKKEVQNEHGGDAGVNDFGLTIGGESVESGEILDVTPGVPVELDEEGLAGYEFVSITGDEACPEALGGTVTVALGQLVSCTITNRDKPAKVTLTKVVENSHGGDAGANDFGLTIGGTVVTSGQVLEVDANTAIALNEAGLDGYEFVSLTGDEGCPAVLGGTVTLANGQSIECTITNRDKPARIKLTKVVNNTHGGNAGANDFGLTIGGTTVTSGQELEVNSNTPIALNEVGLEGYTFVGMGGDVGCPAVLGGTVTLDEGGSIACTITNEEVARPAKVTLTKAVTNGFGGTAGPNDFGLTVGGQTVTSGQTVEVQPDTPVALNEVGLAGYKFVSITGDAGCPTELGGFVTVAQGASIACTITNEEIDRTISVDIVKSADATLLDPEGQVVTFTATITNTSVELPVVITSLTDSDFGDLLAGGNSQVVSTNCPDLAGDVLAPNGGSASCTFSAEIAQVGSEPHVNTVTVVVTEEEGERTATDESTLDIPFTSVPTPTPTPVVTPASTPTPKPSPTPSPTASPTRTASPSPTATVTATPTRTPSPTPTASPTRTPTPVSTPVIGATPSPVPPATATPPRIAPKPPKTGGAGLVDGAGTGAEVVAWAGIAAGLTLGTRLLVRSRRRGL